MVPTHGQVPMWGRKSSFVACRNEKLGSSRHSQSARMSSRALLLVKSYFGLECLAVIPSVDLQGTSQHAFPGRTLSIYNSGLAIVCLRLDAMAERTRLRQTDEFTVNESLCNGRYQIMWVGLLQKAPNALFLRQRSQPALAWPSTFSFRAVLQHIITL